MDRLAWKTNIIAKIEKQEGVDPMKVPLDLSDDTEFQRGFVEGTFLRKPFVKISPRTSNGEVGYHVLLPFQMTTGEVVLVNHGWVANIRAELPLWFSQARKIAGYLQTPDAPNSFTPPNNVEQGLWYWVDMKALSNMYDVNLYDKVLYMESPSWQEPKTFVTLPKPRNKHMQYMIFWFGMAGVWVLMSLLVYFKRVKNS